MDQRGYRRYSGPTRASRARASKSYDRWRGSQETHHERRWPEAGCGCTEEAVGRCEKARQARGQTSWPEEAQAQRGCSQGDHSGYQKTMGGCEEGWGEERKDCCLVKLTRICYRTPRVTPAMEGGTVNIYDLPRKSPP